MAAARLELQPETASAGPARRWVAAQLAGLPPDLVDAATLLTSETVTNAVLHAGTDIEIMVHRRGSRVRVEVVDHSPTLPFARQFAPDAATGRGLVLLDAMADAWGVESLPDGKVVWFELVDDRTLAPVPDAMDGDGPGATVDTAAGSAAPSSATPAGAADEPDDPGELIDVHLIGMPLDLLERVSQQYEALFRELRLMVELYPSETHTVPARLLTVVDELTHRYGRFGVGTDATILLARERGDRAVDLDYRLPVSIGPAAGRYDALLDEADAYCREGVELLTLAPPPEATRFRRWLLQEFVRQSGGAAPTPWPESPLSVTD